MTAPTRRPILAALAAALVGVGLVAVPPAAALPGDVSVSGPNPDPVVEPAGVRRVAFTITLDRAEDNTDTVTVDYLTTTDGTATPNQDYIPVNGTAVFTGTKRTERVTVDVLGDALDEDDETFTLELSGYDQIAVGSAMATIVDNDAPPRVSITDAVVEEADTSSVNARFTVALSSASGRPVSVKWATADDTATAGADYTAGSDTLTFDPGEVSKVVTVAVAGDLLDELDEERFHVNLSEPSNVTLGSKSTGVGRILDNDSPPALSISDATGPEGGQADFTVSLSTESGRQVSVSAATAGGTATPNVDYTARSESLVFEPGQTTKTFSVPLLADGIDEPAETFQATLSGAQAAVIVRASGTGTIVDTNPGPELSITDAEVVEGDAVATMNFTVTLSGTPGQPVSVNFETADGTAKAVQDYAATTGTLAFLANLGDQTRQISVPVVGDNFAELDETFTVRLTTITPQGAAQIAHGQGQATGTILDDDGVPAKVSIADAPPVTEDADGATAVFTVTLERAVPEPAVFTYTTRDGTARAGEDYEARTGTVEFAPGDTTEEIRVPIRADALDEEDTETFTVELSAPINGVIDRGSATGTITDDDAPPTVSIEDDITLEEGNETPSSGVVVVRLAAPSGRTVTVGFTTGPEDPDDPDTADATPGVDYSAESAGTLTFPPGAVRRTIPVAALPDDLDEDLEWFQAAISVTEASHATLGAKPVALVAIEDGDVTPVVFITGPDPVVEPADGDEERVRFTISLSAVSGREVTVPVTFADGTATDPEDWRPAPDNPTEVMILPGETGGAATVRVVGDGTDEPNEDFTATMGAPTNARLPEDPDARTAEAVILDGDGDPTLTVFGSTVTEGDGGTTPAPATVRLVPSSDAEVTVRLSTGNGSAVAPDDYTSLSEVLTFTPGQTAQTRNVAVAGDVVDEVTETFALGLSEPAGAAVDPDGATGTVTISDDDGPSISVNDVTVAEGTGATTRAAFLVTLSGPSPQPVSVDYATSAGTATAEEDFTSLQAQSHTFAPGETATTVEVEVIGDSLDEADEEFTLGLSNPVNASIGRGLGVATIVDDDQPTLIVSAAAGSLDAPSVAETDFGSASLVFTLALDAPTSRESSVAYATANGQAVPGTDFLPASGRVTFAPGETVTTVEVSVIGDSLDEADEGVRLGLSDPDNLTIPGEGLGTILDDDGPGYALVASDGGIFNYGETEFYGSTGDIPLNQPIVGMAAHPSGRGYWLVAADGGIFAFGEAGFFGSTGALRLNRPIVGMAATPTGDGYWLVASDGGIFAFGDAGFFGSTGALTLNRPVVGMAAAPSGDGYWLVASDGGIFAFGDAAFFGSTGAMTLNRPIVGMAPTPSGAGYWLVADDGGIFAFGDAEFLGSTGNMKLNRPVVAMAPL